MNAPHTRRILRALLAVGIAISFLAAGDVRAFTPPRGFVNAVLGNGLEVTILPDSSLPVVATRIWYHVGSANEGTSERGLAHLLEHLMHNGTAARDRGVWEAFHHRRGGYCNALTSWDETRYESVIAPGGLAEVLAMEADRMVNLRLDRPSFEREKRVVVEELRALAENDPVKRLVATVLRVTCGRHPYALEPYGSREDLAAMPVGSARDFYARYYSPDNAHLVVVGPVDGPETLRQVARLFGTIPRAGAQPPEVPSLFTWPFPARVSLEEDLPPVNLAVLGYPMPPPDSPDDAALCLMRELLAGGQTNPFRDDLVRSHQALDAGCRASSARRGGVLCFYSAVLPYRSEKGQFAVMDRSLRRLAGLEWLTDQGLDGVKRRVLRRMEYRRYSASEQADALAEARWWRGDVRLAFEQADRVAAVTRADVAAVFDRYVLRATPTRVHIRPQRVPLLLRLFGWLYPLVARWL